MPERVNAHDLIAKVLDPSSWQSWDSEPEQPDDIGDRYRQELARARTAAGTDEALITGCGTIGGRRVGVVVGEFGFLAGSIGRAASRRLVGAIHRSTDEGLPLFVAPASGGTRMQEGTPAFVSMIGIAAAVTAHKNAGLPYVVYLRHPTTGGVFASWGSLGHFTVAEPGALIGFLGPRVYESLYGEEFPNGVQTAENLYRRGLVDAVLGPDDLAPVAAAALEVLAAPRGGAPTLPEPPVSPLPEVDAWTSIVTSRRPDRPGVRALLKIAAAPVVPLSGTAEGESDASMLIALAKFGDTPCVVIGQDRKLQASASPLGPAGLREARRGMRIAQELKLPLVSVIDTSGAQLSREAEEGALAGEIARCLSDLVMLGAPTLCLLLGEGAGGGAIALLPADVVIGAQHAWLSPLPPEGASAILYRDTAHAAQLAQTQQVRSTDLVRLGIVDRIVEERPDAAAEPEEFCQRVSGVIQYELGQLLAVSSTKRLEHRLARYEALT